MTLTTTPGTEIVQLRRRIHSVAKKIRHHFGEFEFIGAVELGPRNGMVHVGLIYYGQFIPQAWLSSVCVRRQLGRVCWIAMADVDQVRYLAKDLVGYVSKDASAGGRVVISRGWLPARSFDDRLLDELSRAKVSFNPARRP